MSGQLYNGLEIHMLEVGKGDAIVVTHWTNSVPVRVLIDAGNVAGADKVMAFLENQKIGHIDHVVCTHPHDDHAAGLIGVLGRKEISIGNFWMHLPWAHINYNSLQASLNSSDQVKVVSIVRASLDTAQQLYYLAKERNIPTSEPFDKATIGPLFVCGPTLPFYGAKLGDFTDFEKLQDFEAAIKAHEFRIMMEDFAAGTIIGGRAVELEEGELGAEPTEPENDTSVILTAIYNGRRMLLTGDAGVPALDSAAQRYNLANLELVQVPHHGSMRNITTKLIETFKPKYAFVSADGSRQHPRRKVINAFKAVGTHIYSTHHPKPTLLHYVVGGTAPNYGYAAAMPL